MNVILAVPNEVWNRGPIRTERYEGRPKKQTFKSIHDGNAWRHGER
jgi:hypothetical protein